MVSRTPPGPTAKLLLNTAIFCGILGATGLGDQNINGQYTYPG